MHRISIDDFDAVMPLQGQPLIDSMPAGKAAEPADHAELETLGRAGLSVMPSQRGLRTPSIIGHPSPRISIIAAVRATSFAHHASCD